MRGVAALWAVMMFWSAPAVAGPVRRTGIGARLATIPVSQIRRGMVGYGLTVFHGTKPERFHVRVLGILPNAFPHEDLIVIMCDDPKFKHAGVAAGMSGSPIYFNGKMAGALAYGPRFAKDPLAMVTPIGNMLAELKRPLHGMGGVKPPAPTATFPFQRRSARAVVRVRSRAVALADRALGRSPLVDLSMTNRLMVPGAGRSVLAGGIRPLGLPVTVSGFDSESLGELNGMLKQYGMFAVRGGAGGSAAVRRYGPQKGFVDGGPIGVQFVRGDFTAMATGTVTAVVGKQLVAFGHPFFGNGEHYLPAVGAWIHLIVASIYSSYKMSSPLNELGSLIQDRRACIAVDERRRAPMIPLSVAVRSTRGLSKMYHVDVLSNPAMAPWYMYLVVKAALRDAVSDMTNAFVTTKVVIRTKRFGALSFTDYLSSTKGAYRSFLASRSRGIALLRLLFSNQFGRVQVQGMDVQVKVDYQMRVAKIVALDVERPTVEPGSIMNLRVTLHRWRAGRYHVNVPVRIPVVPDGSVLRIRVEAGSQVKPDFAPPRTVKDVIRIYRRTYSSKQLVVTVRTAGEGTTVGDRLITELPGSVLDSMRSATHAENSKVLTKAWRKVMWLGNMLMGSKDIRIRVQSRR
ncbi:MAG: hypothetical protein J7M25_00870 [Deltaproteobacteria bacterium]|nr:hypothetical protein [Deltaproteobacteria bacterium]